MKKLFVLFLLTAVGVFAQAEKLDFGSHGKLTIYIADNWSFETSDFGDRRIVKIVPKSSSVNANLEMTITFPETDRFDTKARLKMRVEIDAMKFADQSVEGKARGTGIIAPLLIRTWWEKSRRWAITRPSVWE